MADSEKKDKILNYASERYFNSGVSNVSMDDLASDLGMSKKTVYKFFPGKKILVRAIVRLMTHRVEKQIQNLVESDIPFEQKMIKMLLIIGKMLGRMSRQFVHDMQRYAPELWEEIENFRRDHILSRLRTMFQEAREQSIFREDLDTDLFYLVFISAVEAVINPLVLSDQSFSAREAFRGILQLLVEGALTEEARETFHFFDAEFDYDN